MTGRQVPASSVPSIKLPSGASIPILGQGTWGMGEQARRRQQEIAALQLGLDLGMTLIDTAGMSGYAGAEIMVGEAIVGLREDIFLVSKVLPHNATRSGTIEACERSLKRLRTETIDLYLLHWRGAPPLAETLEGFVALMRAGKIRHWGVSNFDVSDMEKLWTLAGGRGAATNQVLYNLTRRGIEFDLMPLCLERRIPIMAYSPIEQGRMLNNRTLKEVAARHEATPAQVALAWLLRQDRVIAIPKAATAAHVRENRKAIDLRLTKEDLAALDKAFPPPTKKRPLEML